MTLLDRTARHGKIRRRERTSRHRQPLPHRRLAPHPAPRRVPLRRLVRLNLPRPPPASRSMWCGRRPPARYRAAAPRRASAIGR
jgi:hypothetical protein